MIDIAIIGGGPSGLTAGIYGGRAGLNTVIFEKTFSGGQMAFTNEIENYPGIEKIAGSELGILMENQAKKFDVDIKNEEIKSIKKKDNIFELETGSGVYEAKTVILSMGASPRTLGIESETRLRGMGVSYCATCDGSFYKGMDVAVVGGGNTAFEDAIYLSRICNKVYLIHRRDEFRADDILQKEAKAISNIELVVNSVVDDIVGKFEVDAVKIKNVKSDEVRDIPVSGVFVAVGTIPNSGLVKDVVKLDDYGYVMTDKNMKTNVDGIYAIGDVRDTVLRQVVTACADGAVATMSAQQYMMQKNGKIV